MPVELLMLILFFTIAASVVALLVCLTPPMLFSLPRRILLVFLAIVIPLSLILWINLTPFPKPTEQIYTIEPNPVANTYISVVDNHYLNVNRVTGEQVDPAKQNLKVTNRSGYSGGLYWTFKPEYSLVNKNLEK